MANENKPLGIVIDDGYRRIPLTNRDGLEVGYFYFNPTDFNIINRYNDLVSNFEYILEPLNSIPDAPENSSDEYNGEHIEAVEKAKERLFEAIDNLFQADASKAFFGKVHPFSSWDGRFYCEIVIEAVGKFISEQMKRETAKLNKRVEKYTKKYKGK